MKEIMAFYTGQQGKYNKEALASAVSGFFSRAA
jgi:hypothetical protein